MRDPNRIPDVLDTFRAYWEKYPDLRLGQIVATAAYLVRAEFDPFYVEDEDLVEIIGRMESGDV